MTGVLTWAGVALCGGLGAAARMLVDAAVTARAGGRFPLGILVVNLTGACALGVLAGAAAPERALLLAGTGLLGGYTTFSTWMVDSERLRADGAPGAALANLGLSTAFGLAAVGLGFAAGRALG